MPSLEVRRVHLSVPVHHVVHVLVVFLESNEVLLHYNATSVYEVVAWLVWVAVHSLSSAVSIHLDTPASVGVGSNSHG